MSTALMDKLRLEILATSSGNAITNHSAQSGSVTGWAAMTGNAQTAAGLTCDGTLTAASGLAFGYSGKAFLSSRVRATSFNLGFCGMRGPTYAVAGLQWTNYAVTVKAPNDGLPRDVYMGVEWINGSGTVLGRTEWRQGRPVAPNEETTFTFSDAPDVGSSGGYINSGTGWTGKVLKAAPSGTATARPYVFWTLGTGSYTIPATAVGIYFYKVMVVTGTTQAQVQGPVFSDVPETWQDLLPKSLTARVTRGGDVDGVTDQLDVGTMVASVKDPLVTPDANDRVRPGRPIRLMALNGSTWEPIFRGKIVQASTSYAGDVPVVTLTGTDAGADLENYPQPLGKSGTFKQRVVSALTNVPISYVVTDAAANVTQATISQDENGTAASQLRVARDSLRGLFYVARDNQLRAFAQASYPSQSPTVTFSDDFADTTAVYYHDIDTSFDSKNAVNTLTVTKTALSETDGQKVYGPYVNQASVDAWTAVAADLKVNDGTPSTLAAAYLAAYANPKIFPASVTYEASGAVSTAIVRELYEAARVKFSKAGLNAEFRIIGIEHDINAGSDKWYVTIRFKPLESTSTVTVTNPPGGADTGPKDLVPYTREVQNGERSITTTANNVAVSGAVVFPKPYESTPRVFATARSSVPGTRVGEVTVLNITTNGCDLYVSSPSNPGAVAVQWHAEPAS